RRCSASAIARRCGPSIRAGSWCSRRDTPPLPWWSCPPPATSRRSTTSSCATIESAISPEDDGASDRSRVDPVRAGRLRARTVRIENPVCRWNRRAATGAGVCLARDRDSLQLPAVRARATLVLGLRYARDEGRRGRRVFDQDHLGATVAEERASGVQRDDNRARRWRATHGPEVDVRRLCGLVLVGPAPAEAGAGPSVSSWIGTESHESDTRQGRSNGRYSSQGTSQNRITTRAGECRRVTLSASKST